MADITCKYDLNISIQPGDTLYASRLSNGQGGTNVPSSSVDTKPKIMGEITAINHVTNNITYNPTGGAPNLTNDHYLMFAKNKLVNYSGITGYYAETEYRNYSTLPAEIFATAVDYVVSSE